MRLCVVEGWDVDEPVVSVGDIPCVLPSRSILGPVDDLVKREVPRNVHEDVARGLHSELNSDCYLQEALALHSENVAQPFVPPLADISHEVVCPCFGARLHVSAPASDPAEAAGVGAVNCCHRSLVQVPCFRPVREQGADCALIDLHL